MVGLDFGAVNLKVCHVRVSAGKKELVAVDTRSVSGLSEDETARNLAIMVRELKIKKPHYVLCVPSNIVITKNIEVPSVDPKEIRGIINLQASRHTPFSREEVIVDYIPIGAYKQNYTKVLLLIVNSSVIKKQFSILEKAGIRVEKVVLAQEGIAVLASRVFKFDPAAATALVHIDDAATEFSIVLRNKAVFIRSIPMGKQQLLADREKSWEKFLDEVKKSLGAYQSENVDKPPCALYVCGSLDGLDNLEAYLSEAGDIPVWPGSYSSVIPAPAPVAARLKETSVLNCLAPVLFLNDCRTSLIPDEIKLKMALARRGRDLVVTAELVFTVLILFFVMMMTQIYFKNAYLKKLEDKYKNLGSEVQKLEKDYQRNSQVRVYLAGRGSSLRVLSELYNIAPLNLELNYIKFEKDGKFTIRGTAESRSTIFSFVDSMEKSPHFKDVKNKNTTKRQEGQKEVTDFEINCLLKNKAAQ